MIYKVEEFEVVPEHMRYKVYRKPLYYWPFWTWLDTVKTLEEVEGVIRKKKPLYFGTKKQILTQLQNKAK